MAADRPKVLIVAQNAASRIGGEAFLPVKYFQILRQRGHPAKLIAHSRNRPDLTETLAPFLDDVHFLEDTAWHRNVWRLGKPLPTAIRKPVFGNIVGQINEVYQKRLIRQLIAQGQVDVIHQPIPVSPRGPSSIHGLGVPVVIGPMNGNMSYPPGYEDYDSRAEQIFTRAARHLGPLANRLIPGKRHAAVLLVANERT
ncbi:group 1 glycosyl transferase, partial [Escherichia coli]|nr:group 1 glycosyl transferase [Escherichia coli]